MKNSRKTQFIAINIRTENLNALIAIKEIKSIILRCPTKKIIYSNGSNCDFLHKPFQRIRRDTFPNFFYEDHNIDIRTLHKKIADAKILSKVLMNQI